MKKITLLFTFAAIGLVLFAQSNPAERRNFSRNDLFRKNPLSLRSDDMKPEPDSLIFYKNNEPDEKETLKYDDKGNLIESIIFEWIASRGGWMSYSKDVMEYDESNHEISTTFYDWENEAWVLAGKVENKYNEQGEMTGRVLHLDSNGDGVFDADINYQIISNYDSLSGNLSDRTFLEVADSGNTPVEKEEFKYDARNNPTEFSVYYYAGNDVWEGDKRFKYEYDDSNKITKGIRSEWDDKTNKWYDAAQFLNIYDRSQRLATTSFYFINSKTGIPDTLPYGQTIYYYGGIPAGMERIPAHSDAKIWFSDGNIYVTSEVDLASVCIYNLSGNLMFRQAAKGSTFVMSSPIRDGIYLVKVTEAGGKIKTSKIIVN